jgi:hypothetical protein
MNSGIASIGTIVATGVPSGPTIVMPARRPGVDVVVHVVGLHVDHVVADAAEAGDRGRPGAELAAVDLELVGGGREQGCAGADVAAAHGLHVGDGRTGELGGAAAGDRRAGP